MQSVETVELMVGGLLLSVQRDSGLAAFERNAALMAAGHVATARVELPGPVPAVLHLVLGAEPIALIERTRAAENGGTVAAPHPHLTAAEVFVDFDEYR